MFVLWEYGLGLGCVILMNKNNDYSKRGNGKRLNWSYKRS